MGKNLEDEVSRELKRLKLQPQELETVIKNLKGIAPKRYLPSKIEFSDKHVKFGIISDLHMGHRLYRPDILDDAAARFKKEGIDFIVNAGDTIEGMSGRDGHIYELSHIGATAQFNYFVEEFKKLAQWPVYSIEAQDSHGGWFHSKGNAGVDVGEELGRRAKNYKFIGYDEADHTLSNGLKIRLSHPGGGQGIYTLSYKAQRAIEAMSGGTKPHIFIQGHFHKMFYMAYRNVHSFDAGTMCDQTQYMKKVRTPAHVGYWIVDVTVKKNGGVETPKFQPVTFYD